MIKFELPPHLVAPVFPTGVNNDTPTERIHRLNNARPFPAFLRQVRTLLNGFHKSFVHLQSLGFLAPASDGFSRSAEDWAKLTKPRAIAAVAVEGEQTLAAVSTQIVRPLAKGKKPYPTDPALLCNMCGRKRHGPTAIFLKLTRTETRTLLRVL